MKKIILALTMLFATATVSAQFYVSGNTGYAFGTGEKVLGTSTTISGSTDLEGSYGEGVHFGLRGGYMFNSKWAVELNVGYLYGTDQEIQKVSLPGVNFNLDGRGRAYGASLSAVYNVTDNFYARAGYLTKLGGKTEAVGSLAIDAIALETDFTTNFRGKFPSGFVGAIGYKYPVANNWSIFAEVEYLGVSVTRNKSEAGDFSATIGGTTVTKDQVVQTLTAVAANPALTDLAQGAILLLNDEVQWGQNGLPAPDAPYSSIGINFGVTYTFGN